MTQHDDCLTIPQLLAWAADPWSHPGTAPDRGAILREVVSVYVGSDGEATRALYARLTAECGVPGIIAVKLLRATKASERARCADRGPILVRSMRERKLWAIYKLTDALEKHGADLGLTWGWGKDETEPFYSDVLFVDIPTGQVSFHTAYRGVGPDYPGAWDGMRHMGSKRVCDWAADLIRATFASQNP